MVFSEGVWQSDTLWYAKREDESCTHLVIANGGTATETFTHTVAGAAITALAGTNPTLVGFENNTVTVQVPAGAVIYCKIAPVCEAGLYTNNARWHTIPTAAFRLQNAAGSGKPFVAVYAESNGVRELLAIFSGDGEIQTDAAAYIKGMTWSVMQPDVEPYILPKE